MNRIDPSLAENTPDFFGGFFSFTSVYLIAKRLPPLFLQFLAQCVILLFLFSSIASPFAKEDLGSSFLFLLKSGQTFAGNVCFHGGKKMTAFSPFLLSHADPAVMPNAGFFFFSSARAAGFSSQQL